MGGEYQALSLIPDLERMEIEKCNLFLCVTGSQRDCDFSFSVSCWVQFSWPSRWSGLVQRQRLHFLSPFCFPAEAHCSCGVCFCRAVLSDGIWEMRIKQEGWSEWGKGGGIEVLWRRWPVGPQPSSLFFFEKKSALGSSLFQPLSTWLLWPPLWFCVGLRTRLAAHCASSKLQQQENKVASSAVSRLRVKRIEKLKEKKVWALSVHVQGCVTVSLLQVHSVILIQLFVPNSPLPSSHRLATLSSTKSSRKLAV